MSSNNSKNFQAAAPGPYTQVLLARYDGDSFPMPSPFSQEEIDSLDTQQMRALLSSMAASASQRQIAPLLVKDNLSATQPSEQSSLISGRFANHATYNWLMVTLAVDDDPLQTNRHRKAA